jgi:hypothetical protein
MILRTVVFSLLLAIPQLANSQGAYLESGESGLWLSGGLAINEDATSIGGGLGFSASTIIDFGISASYASFDGDMSAVMVSPDLTIFVIKQGRNRMPLNVSLRASFEHGFFSSKYLDFYGLDMNSDFGSVGLSLSGNMRTGPGFMLHPYAGFGFVFGQAKISDNMGNYIRNSDETFSAGAGLSLLFKSGPSSQLVLTFGGSANEDVVSFQMSLGLLFTTLTSTP